MDPSEQIYSVTTLLGKDDVISKINNHIGQVDGYLSRIIIIIHTHLKAEVHVFGRAIAGHISLPPNSSLLLGLGLKDHNLQLIAPLLPKLEPFKTWTTKNPAS
ncbi:MAG: hypothetical protein MJE68_26985 [Proteobacteria bacterium]|nr:hypothetical protein [Pseudomonadota bacterium]